MRTKIAARRHYRRQREKIASFLNDLEGKILRVHGSNAITHKDDDYLEWEVLGTNYVLFRDHSKWRVQIGNGKVDAGTYDVPDDVTAEQFLASLHADKGQQRMVAGLAKKVAGEIIDKDVRPQDGFVSFEVQVDKESPRHAGENFHVVARKPSETDDFGQRGEQGIKVWRLPGNELVYHKDADRTEVKNELDSPLLSSILLHVDDLIGDVWS